jgi:3-hydroxyisobutyrate dehydrogenase-like beta-hydroxyacid dehydrogenase
MNGVTVGLLHPGEMGAAVGGCLAGAGRLVMWAPEGRSVATAARAEAAGLTAARDVAEIARRSDVIISVCPPHAAVDVARQVAGLRFRGSYVDANAISPATARQVAAIVGDADYVDGGIIGSPPVPGSGHTRLYLSGPQADRIRRLFEGTAVDARIIERDLVGAASAVKMAYAAWTKGAAALLLTARALARAEEVEEVLLAEWAMSQPDLPGRSDGAARSAAAKGWRWTGEMEQIAETMQAAALPEGFHRAAAEVYRRWPQLLADRASAGAQALGQVGFDGVQADTLLTHVVTVPDRHRLVVQGVEVDGDAVWGADLILPPVAAPDRAGVVELGVPALAQNGRQVTGLG